MPSKHAIRNFAENRYYHVFNRGVEKRQIFFDKQDYQMFKYYIFIYLSPLDIILKKYPNFPPRLHSKNLSSEVELISYCLMPNHFHLLLKQTSIDAISRFMRQLSDGYTRYFNEKYDRVGSLMQGRFKAASISSDDVLLHISRYIHLNPLVDGLVKNLRDYAWSSHLSYLNIIKENFISNQIILKQFPSISEYEKFVNDQASYAKELAKVKHTLIED